MAWCKQQLAHPSNPAEAKHKELLFLHRKLKALRMMFLDLLRLEDSALEAWATSSGWGSVPGAFQDLRETAEQRHVDTGEAVKAWRAPFDSVDWAWSLRYAEEFPEVVTLTPTLAEVDPHLSHHAKDFVCAPHPVLTADPYNRTSNPLYAMRLPQPSDPGEDPYTCTLAAIAQIDATALPPPQSPKNSPGAPKGGGPRRKRRLLAPRTAPPVAKKKCPPLALPPPPPPAPSTPKLATPKVTPRALPKAAPGTPRKRRASA